MRNPKKRIAMENNIELFDRYIDGLLTPGEKGSFDARLRTDKEFASDFRIYLFSLKGIIQEEEQDNMDFGVAMKSISKDELLRIIGRKPAPRVLRLNHIHERLAWAASIAAVLLIGIFTAFNIHRNAMYRVDDTIGFYNYIPESNRGWETISGKDIPSLQQAYATASADDSQAQQDAGMRLAMAYLKVHNRKKAKEILSEMSERFANDTEFVAQCRIILDQLK